jgi:glycosyltransferase involved in cell wall biosynthesis
MRIGIDARFLTHPQAGGFKTYTENLIQALSQVDAVNRYVLYLDREPADGILPKAENFTHRVVPTVLPLVGMPFREQVLLGRHIAKDQLDLIHFLCNTAPVNMPANSVLTLHDTIQVTIQQDFPLTLSVGEHKRWAMTAYSKWTILKTARAAGRVITVSNYEKDLIVQHLGVDPHRVCVAHLAPNPVFTPANREVREEYRAELRQKFSLSSRFLLGVGYEARKNIPLLIEAFARLAPDHQDLDLVIVAAEEGRRFVFQRMVSGQNLNDQVKILAAVEPGDLVALYNLAEVFVYPSERESFGLPPLEAMACGAPTIAMNMTSLPEVLGGGAILIDGKDPQTWADAIRWVLTDDVLRKDLVSRGIRQGASMTWQRCAEKTKQIYRAVAEADQLVRV